MELRPPPSTSSAKPSRDGLVRILLMINLLLLLAVGGYLLFGSPSGSTSGDSEHAREIASKLKAGGALDEAADLYEVYLSGTEAPAETRANIAYSLGSTYLDAGRHQKALRWFYEAETLGVGKLSEELSKKIVHTLERLGRRHSAQAALDARVQLGGPGVQRAETDPVVAKIGEREIYRSEVLRALDDLPTEMAAQFTGPQRGELLKKHVADELLWRKAAKLEYDRDPEVLRSHEEMLKQLAVSRFVEKEVISGLEIDPSDVRNYFEANRARYEKEGETLEEMPPEAERDYRMSKLQTEYQKLIDAELATADVRLFPENMNDG